MSLALRVVRADGLPAVLKVNFPERETEHEGTALAHWGGVGAVRLLAERRELGALLVERCDPGTQLWSVADEEEAYRIGASVLRRLWREPPPSHPFVLLRDLAERWAVEVEKEWQDRGRPYERSLLEAGLAVVRDLGPSQDEVVVCHQDLHGGNVLRATRDGWLAIDPKPIVGERAFDTASLVRDRRESLLAGSSPGKTIERRLDQLAAELDLDRERMRGWGIAHALAWGSNEAMIECARLLAAV